MKHIRQINSEPYTVVNTSDYKGKLEEHPSIVNHPELFEIVDEDIPNDVQYLNYSE